MNKVVIHSPIWSKQAIGIAEDKMLSDLLIIEIDYTTRDGKRLYPDPFFIRKDKAMEYPIQEWRGHRLRIIPIAELR